MGTSSQEQIRQELRRGRSADRVHGAYLFEGAPGTGHQETAYWFARLLLCRAQETEPCERCRDCRKTAPAKSDEAEPPQHPDLKQVQPDGAFLKVDQIRELQRALGLRAHEGGWRIALILGAETLRVQAANALLKTLEEPRPRTTLLLVAERSAGLPATVRSRTLHLRFQQSSEASIRSQLMEQGLPESDAWLGAALGGASVETAQAWTEQHLEEAREMSQLLGRTASLPASALLDFAGSFRGGGQAMRLRTELMLDVYAAFVRHEVEKAAEQGRHQDLEYWLSHAETGQRTHSEWRRRNLNAQLLVEGLLFGLQPRLAG